MLKIAEPMQESQSAGAAVARKPKRRITVVILASLALLVAVGVGLYWQATRGSVSLAYLNGRVEAAISQRLPPDASISVGSTAFSYRDGQGVILRIKELGLLLPGMATVTVSELSTVTTARALLAGRIDLQSVTVTGADIGVSALPAAGREGTGADLVRQLATNFMDEVVEADDLIRGAGLQEVLVRDATIGLDDAGAAATPALQIGEANWLPLSPDRSKAWVQIVEPNGAGWDLTLERRKTQAGNTVVNLEFEDVPSTALVPQLAGMPGGPRFRALVTLQMRMAQTAERQFVGLRGALSASEGELSFTGKDEINLVSSAINFVLDADGDRMSIPSGDVRTLTGRVAFEGVADLSELGHATLVARIREGSLATPVGDSNAVQIAGGGGVARINFADIGVDVERLEVVTPEGTASAIGQASLAGASPGLSFALSFEELSAGAARAMWPPFVAAKLRRWFEVNVRSGTLGPATLQVALPLENIGPRNRGKILPDYALVGSLPFRDAAFSPIRTFPVITSASGEIVFGNATAQIVAQSGVVNVPDRGVLQAAGTTLTIPELGRLKPRGELHLELAGAAPALAAASNTPPLSVARDRGIGPDDITGEATLSLDANIPLYESDFSDVIPNFRLALSEFSSESPIDGRTVSEADLVLEGNPRSYTVKGEGVLDGYRASVDLIQGSAAPDQSAVTVELDEAARKRMGLAFGKLMTGPAQAFIMNTGELGQQVALDLKQTRINIPFLGWEKGPGVPATASFVMNTSDEGTRLTKFLLSGKGFEARGELLIGPDGRLQDLSLERVALRPGDQLTARVTAEGSGYKVSINGSVLDARGIIRRMGDGALAGDLDIFPIRVSVNVDVLRGENDVSLSDVKGAFTVTRSGLETVSLKGNARGEPFEWTLTRDGNQRTLRVLASAGGDIVRFAGIYGRVVGGNLILDYSGEVGGNGTGVLVMRDFAVVNEEALKDVLEPSSPRAGMVHAYSATGEAYQFTQLRIPFRQEGWVITIDDAALRGVSIGATSSGTINVPDGKIAVSGTLIPAFGLNNIAGAIPLLGAILGGGRDEGLVGITYKLFGPLDNPSLVVNPVSAIAPGIFRKIFEYR